jgi:hypothetical protein
VSADASLHGRGPPGASCGFGQNCNACSAGNCRLMVLAFLRECVRQPREPPHALSHREILTLHKRRADVRRIGVAGAVKGLHPPSGATARPSAPAHTSRQLRHYPPVACLTSFARAPKLQVPSPRPFLVGVKRDAPTPVTTAWPSGIRSPGFSDAKSGRADYPLSVLRRPSRCLLPSVRRGVPSHRTGGGFPPAPVEPLPRVSRGSQRVHARPSADMPPRE